MFTSGSSCSEKNESVHFQIDLENSLHTIRKVVKILFLMSIYILVAMSLKKYTGANVCSLWADIRIKYVIS